MTVRAFERSAKWANPDGTLTDRAAGFLRNVVDDNSARTFASVTAIDGFGCNGKTAQTEYTVNAAVTGTAGGAYTANEQTMISDLQSLVNQLRAALVANGVVV